MAVSTSSANCSVEAGAIVLRDESNEDQENVDRAIVSKRGSRSPVFSLNDFWRHRRHTERLSCVIL